MVKTFARKIPVDNSEEPWRKVGAPPPPLHHSTNPLPLWRRVHRRLLMGKLIGNWILWGMMRFEQNSIDTQICAKY
jgi:hypothetical protein